MKPEVNGSNPPGWGQRLLKFLLHHEVQEEIIGDLEEAYHWRLQTESRNYALLKFLVEIILSIKPQHLKPIHAMSQFFMLFENHLKSGWRFILKNKGYASLNILGLAMGIAICWLAYFHSQNELSFDRHLPAHDRLYRIIMDINFEGQVDHIGGSSHAMSVAYAEQIPEIASVTKLKTEYGILRVGEESFQQNFLLSDTSITENLGLQFLEGSQAGFSLPSDVIISESLAGKLNLRGKAVGTTISILLNNEFRDFIIKGVYADIPLNTSITSEMFVHYGYYQMNAEERRLTNWLDVNMNSLLKLHPDANLNEVNKKMNVIFEENFKEDIGDIVVKLQPIADIHLDANYGHYNGIVSGGDTYMINFFVGIGILCLLIAMINYSNFNISLYINRSREVALRKVIGAGRSNIFSQLITESFISSTIAGLLAIGLIIFLLPLFADFLQKAYDPWMLLRFDFVAGAILILIMVAFISGLYPAIILSRFPIVKSLSGEQKITGGKWITQILLGLQFLIASVLIFGALTVNNQLRYLSDFDIKANYANVINLYDVPGDDEAIKRFLNDLKGIPEIENATALSGYNGTRISTEGGHYEVRHLRIHEDLISQLDLNLLSGRNFKPELGSAEHNNIIVNRALVSLMGIEEPIGKKIPFNYGDYDDAKIIGMVDDYHFRSAKSGIEPLVIYTSPRYPLQHIYVKWNDTSPFQSNKLASIWDKHFSPHPFDFGFMDAYFERALNAEKRMLSLVSIGCGVSIFLSIIGLLGIVGIHLNQKLKEISIRKVLGANRNALHQIVLQRFIMVVGLGLIAGLGLGFYMANDWLQQYPYRIEPGWGLAITTMALVASISINAILWQVGRVASANPIQYLRKE